MSYLQGPVNSNVAEKRGFTMVQHCGGTGVIWPYKLIFATGWTLQSKAMALSSAMLQEGDKAPNIIGIMTGAMKYFQHQHR